MMFVEQQVQLIERRPRHLPVVFLVQVAQCHGVRKELVEIFDALFTDALGQGDRQLDDVPEWLDLMRVLMRERLGPVQDCVCVDQSFCHRLLPVRRPADLVKPPEGSSESISRNPTVDPIAAEVPAARATPGDGSRQVARRRQEPARAR